MAQIDTLLEQLVALGGSDLHLSSGNKPLIRESGEIKELDLPIFDDQEAAQCLREIMPKANRSQFDECNDTDFAYDRTGIGRFRVNVFRDRNGLGGVFRVIPTEILSTEQLSLPATVTDFCNLAKGLVVVTGPTGSGKSTTLAAMVDYVNRTRSAHIITVEDPIEFVHNNKKCLINQREVNSHTRSFASALRAALREDPDIVLVGEMRDLETIEMAIQTAETGHLVFATLHTNTAASTVDRIIDVFPADRQNQIRTMLACSLKGVVAQTLCKRKPKGRVAALEIMVVTRGISALIRDGKAFQIPSAMQIGGAQGMVLLNDSLAKLVHDDVMDMQQAYDKAVDKDELVDKLKKLGHYLKASGEPAGQTAGAAGNGSMLSAARIPEAASAAEPDERPEPEAGQVKICDCLTICGEQFRCCPMPQAVPPQTATVYVVLGVDQWGTWTILDVGQTDEAGDATKAAERQACWKKRCPSNNLWFGLHAVIGSMPAHRRVLESRILVEHNPACAWKR